MRKFPMIPLTLALVISGCTQSLPSSQTSSLSHQEQLNIPASDPARTTVLRLFQTAVMPVGHTLYIWGGGWNEEDTGGGEESVTLGLSPEWEAFYSSQDSTYDYSQHLYEIHEGLDCSGYIGWVIYNLLENENNASSYVTFSPDQPALLEQRGLGRIIPADEIEEVLPGDIFNSADHIYMVIKAFEDGSRLIVHSSPPGVQFSGTPDAQGNKESEAAGWASQIMSEYFPDYYGRYPNVSVDSVYNSFDQFRFDESIIANQKKADQIKTEELISLMMRNTARPSLEQEQS